jgi:hypothetical protein
VRGKVRDNDGTPAEEQRVTFMETQLGNISALRQSGDFALQFRTIYWGFDRYRKGLREVFEKNGNYVRPGAYLGR